MKPGSNSLFALKGYNMCQNRTHALILLLLLFTSNGYSANTTETTDTPEKDKTHDSIPVPRKTMAVPYLHIDLGFGLTSLDNSDGLPTFFAEIGLGAFLSHFGLEANFRYAGFVIFHVLNAYASLSYFPNTGDNLWFIKGGFGYFYQRFQFDGPIDITQGLPFIAGLGWCWKTGICIELDYTYNLLLHSSAKYLYESTSYAEHFVVFSVSFSSALPGKKEE